MLVSTLSQHPPLWAIDRISSQRSVANGQGGRRLVFSATVAAVIGMYKARPNWGMNKALRSPNRNTCCVGPSQKLRRCVMQSIRADIQQAPRSVHVLTACNEYRQETVILERSALRAGCTFRAVGLGSDWHGLGTKLAVYDKALQQLVGGFIGPEDIVLLLDAWDTVMLGHASELHAKLGQMGALGPTEHVICAADRICAPEYKIAPQMERLYPDIRTPWRYPNSGGFAGTGRSLAHFMHQLVQGAYGGSFSEANDDQLHVQTFLLACAKHGKAFPLIIDEDCRIFQCMGEPRRGWDYEDRIPAPGKNSNLSYPRIRNQVTGERSSVAHGCGGHGRWFLADVYRELDLLQYLDISEKDLAGLQYAGLVPPGDSVAQEHWVNQPPWDYPFILFEAIRAQALQYEHNEQNAA